MLWSVKPQWHTVSVYLPQAHSSKWSISRQLRSRWNTSISVGWYPFKPVRFWSVREPISHLYSSGWPSSAPVWPGPLITPQLDPNTNANMQQNTTRRQKPMATLRSCSDAGRSRARLSCFSFFVIHLRRRLPKLPSAAQPRPVCFVGRNGFILPWRCSGGCAAALCVCEWNTNSDKALISFAEGNRKTIYFVAAAATNFFKGHIVWGRNGTLRPVLF